MKNKTLLSASLALVMAMPAATASAQGTLEDYNRAYAVSYTHLDVYKRQQLTHKGYLHLDNIYHSPYVIEWWAEKHGLESIAQLYREGKVGEDPAVSYTHLDVYKRQGVYGMD